jgi:hypothetical protein
VKVFRIIYSILVLFLSHYWFGVVIILQFSMIYFCWWLAKESVKKDILARKVAISRGNRWAPYIGEYTLDTYTTTIPNIEEKKKDDGIDPSLLITMTSL